MPQEAEIKTYKCRHIFADGHRCGARSLRGEDFCFYHHTTRRPKPHPRAAPQSPAEATFDLPNPEDRTSIQISIGEVLRRIASNQIDPRRAGLLLYGLQIASLNLPREPRPPPSAHATPAPATADAPSDATTTTSPNPNNPSIPSTSTPPRDPSPPSPSSPNPKKKNH